MNPKEIQEVRHTLGDSQYRFSRETGIERSRLSLLENGHVNATPEEVQRIQSYSRRAAASQRDRLDRLVSLPRSQSVQEVSA